MAEELIAMHRKKVKDDGTYSPDLLTDKWYTSFSRRFLTSVVWTAYKFSAKNILDGFDYYDERWRQRRGLLVEELDRNAPLAMAACFL